MLNKLISVNDVLSRKKRDGSIDDIVLQHYADKPSGFILDLAREIQPNIKEYQVRNRASQMGIKRDQQQVRITTLIYENYTDKPDDYVLTLVTKNTGAAMTAKELTQRAVSMNLVKDKSREQLHRIILDSYFIDLNADIAIRIKSETGIEVAVDDVTTIAAELGLIDRTTIIGRNRIRNEILQHHYEESPKELILDLVREKTGEEIPDEDREWYLLEVRASRVVKVHRKAIVYAPRKRDPESVRLDQLVALHYADKPTEYLDMCIERELGKSVKRNIVKKRASLQEVKKNHLEIAINTIIYHGFRTMPIDYLINAIEEETDVELKPKDVRRRAKSMELVQDTKEVTINTCIWNTFLREFNRDIKEMLLKETGEDLPCEIIVARAQALGLIDPQSSWITDQAINTIIRNLNTDEHHRSMLFEMIREKTGREMHWDQVARRITRMKEKEEAELRKSHYQLTPAEKEVLELTYPFLTNACMRVLFPEFTRSQIKFRSNTLGILKTGRDAIDRTCREHNCTIEQLFQDAVLKDTASVDVNGRAVKAGDLFSFYQTNVLPVIPPALVNLINRDEMNMFIRLLTVEPKAISEQVFMDLFSLYQQTGLSAELLPRLSRLVVRHYGDKPQEYVDQCVLQAIGTSISGDILNSLAVLLNVTISEEQKTANSVIYLDYSTMPDGYLISTIQEQTGLQLLPEEIHIRAQEMGLKRDKQQVIISGYVWDDYFNIFNSDIAQSIEEDADIHFTADEVNKVAQRLGLIDLSSRDSVNKAIDTIINNLIDRPYVQKEIILGMIKEKTGRCLRWDDVLVRAGRKAEAETLEDVPATPPAPARQDAPNKHAGQKAGKTRKPKQAARPAVSAAQSNPQEEHLFTTDSLKESLHKFCQGKLSVTAMEGELDKALFMVRKMQQQYSTIINVNQLDAYGQRLEFYLKTAQFGYDNHKKILLHGGSGVLLRLGKLKRLIIQEEGKQGLISDIRQHINNLRSKAAGKTYVSPYKIW